MRLLFCGVVFLTMMSVSYVHANVCSSNDYALCSHANCECLDENGEVGECEPYDFINPGSSKGWARCTCPVVKHREGDIAYNSNFATLDCDTLNNPQDSLDGNAFPAFDHLTDQKVEVYSAYSYGDSLDNRKFGTLKNASLMVCDEPKLMTLCLDMPCTVGTDGDVAECYCQNAPAVPDENCQSDNKCSLTVWNTLGGDCDQNQCNAGENRVWSAAYVPQTLQGINDLYSDISAKVAGFKDIAGYCPNN